MIHIAKLSEYISIEKFIDSHLNQLQQKFDQCTSDLVTQSLSCPKTLSLTTVDSRLQEFVRLHHIDLTRKVNYHINKFKDNIRERKLFKDLSAYSLTTQQVIISRCILQFDFLFFSSSRRKVLIVLSIFVNNS